MRDEAVREALQRAFADGSWGRYHGPHCDTLRQHLAELHATEFVSLCCSGTVAVELALRGVGVGQGDEVLLAGYDFGGNFRSIEAVGARPVLVDVDAENWNLAPRRLDEAWSPRVRAVIASHLHGGVVPMSEVVEFAERRGVAVVEDACQAPGATIEGRIAGTWGDVGVLSFGGSKLLSAGRGGALLTSHPEVRQRIKLFCERGNHAFPLSELQAAVLLPQLARLEQRNAARLAAARRILARVAKLPALGELVNRTQETSPGYFKLGLKYSAAALGGCPRESFIAAIQAEGVALDAGFRDFTRRSPKRCRHATSLEESRRAGRAMLVLHHPILLESPEEVDRLGDALEKVVRVRCRRET